MNARVSGQGITLCLEMLPTTLVTHTFNLYAHTTLVTHTFNLYAHTPMHPRTRPTQEQTLTTLERRVDAVQSVLQYLDTRSHDAHAALSFEEYEVRPT